MRKGIRKAAAALCILLCAAALSACGARNALRDGYYSATYNDYDEHGWKEYVTIFVSGGRIASVEYNARNESGMIKSWDMEYMREMSAADGTYPNEYTRDYAGQLLAGQGTGEIQALTGATHSYHTFLALANAALEHARSGDRDVALLDPA